MDGLVFGSSHLLYSRYPLVSFNNGSGYLGGILAVSLARYCGIIIKLAGLSFGKVFNKFATFSWRHDLEHWFNIGCRQIYKAPQDSTSAYDLISGLHVEPYHDRKEVRFLGSHSIGHSFTTGSEEKIIGPLGNVHD